MNNCLAVMVMLILSACCKDGLEVNKYALSNFEKESIPYIINKATKFRHSNGFEFSLTTVGSEIRFNKTQIRHCGDSYSTYEELKIELASNIPELYINLQLVPKQFSPYMLIGINNYYFGIDITSVPDIDTLTINGKKYANIYQAESETLDTLKIRPRQVLYNKQLGIIQITMTDNEKFTLDE